MQTRRAKPLQPPREERRALLARHFVEVVEPLLEAGESYADLSVERLITEVDISRSTFYVYFDDKGDLLSAMGQDVTVEFSEAGQAWFNLPGTARRSPSFVKPFGLSLTPIDATRPCCGPSPRLRRMTPAFATSSLRWSTKPSRG